MSDKRVRTFTEAARMAALKIRRERQAQKVLDPNPLEVFVTRSGIRFGWEIRKFGAVTIEASPGAFDDPHLAREAGLAALDAARMVRPDVSQQS